MNWIRTLCCCIAMTAVLSLTLTGCTSYKEVKKDPPAKGLPHPEKGPRGGPIAEWGEDDYHVEFTIENKSPVLYILDGLVKDGVKVEPSKITDVKMTVADPKLELDMKFDEKRSGGGKIVFVNASDAFTKAASEYKGTISGKVSGKPYAGEFPHKE